MGIFNKIFGRSKRGKVGKCTRCGTKAPLTEARIRAATTGREVVAQLCPKCYDKLLEETIGLDVS
jgi:hypothetical protein